MTDKDAKGGERIAKVLSRAGVASRREAERMIEAGRVAVNGTVIDRAALNVTPRDKVTVDGQPIDAPAAPRLWLYHKPPGLVTTTKDEQGRPTIYDALPEDMPRVMSVGRLDLTSEGLLLLTNDGGIKRQLELPSTGWTRKYRVRMKGTPSDATFEPLRQGITVDGDTFQPMTVVLDRQQGANAWATVTIREGKNREIRRAMSAVGLVVNRLIRVSFGPFRLGELKPGAVEEVRQRVLRDQLGLEAPEPEAGAPAARARTGSRPRGKGPARPGGKGPAHSGSKGAARAEGKDAAGPRTKDLTAPEGKSPAGAGGKGPAAPGGKRPAGPGGKPGARPGLKPRPRRNAPPRRNG